MIRNYNELLFSLNSGAHIAINRVGSTSNAKSRPRKCLKYQTLHKMFRKKLAVHLQFEFSFLNLFLYLLGKINENW